MQYHSKAEVKTFACGPQRIAPWRSKGAENPDWETVVSCIIAITAFMKLFPWLEVI